ncbi:MAG: hypothetical protein ACLP9L_09210, partial [Thermoguttaceae bacterium]
MTDPKPIRRRFCPTPTWLVLALLIVEGLLWLSERFQWFAFNAHKGWTVLIAAAVVGVTFLVMLVWFAASLLFRWPFRFSIRSLLVLVVVVALPFSWLAVEMKEARRQHQSVEEVTTCGGMTCYDYQSNGVGHPEYDRPLSEPQLLLRWFGTDFFHPVVWVSFSVGDLDGTRMTRISEKELSCLDGLVNLKVLDLQQQPIGNGSLAYLRNLSQLEKLDLTGTLVTDAGMEHVNRMRQLEDVDLRFTQITEEGVKNL